jgi:hypothetical protein
MELVPAPDEMEPGPGAKGHHRTKKDQQHGLDRHCTSPGNAVQWLDRSL